MSPNTSKRPRPKYLGADSNHPIEHGNDASDAAPGDDLVGTPPHAPAEDLRAEEPSREAEGSTEID